MLFREKVAVILVALMGSGLFVLVKFGFSIPSGRFFIIGLIVGVVFDLFLWGAIYTPFTHISGTKKPDFVQDMFIKCGVIFLGVTLFFDFNDFSTPLAYEVWGMLTGMSCVPLFRKDYFETRRTRGTLKSYGS
jgi:hypothetical protein